MIIFKDDPITTRIRIVFNTIVLIEIMLNNIPIKNISRMNEMSAKIECFIVCVLR
jgi:hypothetical protein